MYIKQKLFGAKVQGLACTLKGTILNIPINTLHSIKPLTDQSSITKKKKKMENKPSSSEFPWEGAG